MTDEQAQHLIHLRKRIIDNSNPVDRIAIDQRCPFHCKFELLSDDDADVVFLWEIKQSSKDALRINLHYQDDDSKIGLLRIDYNSGHHNPEIITENVPERFKPYVGKWFNGESHIHYYVEGYKPLAWAVPLENVDDITVKQLADTPDFNQQFITAILEFAKLINIETVIQINPLLL